MFEKSILAYNPSISVADNLVVCNSVISAFVDSRLDIVAYVVLASVTSSFPVWRFSISELMIENFSAVIVLN